MGKDNCKEGKRDTLDNLKMAIYLEKLKFIRN